MICCTACSHSFFVEPHLIFEPSFHSFLPQNSGPWTWHVFLISTFSPDPGQIQVIFVVEKLPLARLFGWALDEVVAKRQRANMVSVKIFSIVYEVSVGWLFDWLMGLVGWLVVRFLFSRRWDNSYIHFEATMKLDIIQNWLTLPSVKQLLHHSLSLILLWNYIDIIQAFEWLYCLWSNVYRTAWCWHWLQIS